MYCHAGAANTNYHCLFNPLTTIAARDKSCQLASQVSKVMKELNLMVSVVYESTSLYCCSSNFHCFLLILFPSRFLEWDTLLQSAVLFSSGAMGPQEECHSCKTDINPLVFRMSC